MRVVLERLREQERPRHPQVEERHLLVQRAGSSARTPSMAKS
jgi:hypothetical protein